jgi:hypothetical protein
MQRGHFKLIAGAAMVAAACAAMAHDRDDDNDAARAALVKARQKIFGVENVDEKGRVDKEKVIFSWATNTTYVASILGRVVPARQLHHQARAAERADRPALHAAAAEGSRRRQAGSDLPRPRPWRPCRQRRVHRQVERRDDLRFRRDLPGHAARRAAHVERRECGEWRREDRTER